MDKLKVCCAADHYGPDCRPCDMVGTNGKICNGNGKCKGGGTRKGNGKCQCSAEYTGEMCNACSEGHYQSFRDESKLLCSACHKSCSGHCTGAGPKACTVCAKGYVMNTEHGCLVRESSTVTSGTFVADFSLSFRTWTSAFITSLVPTASSVSIARAATDV